MLLAENPCKHKKKTPTPPTPIGKTTKTYQHHDDTHDSQRKALPLHAQQSQHLRKDVASSTRRERHTDNQAPLPTTHSSDEQA